MKIETHFSIRKPVLFRYWWLFASALGPAALAFNPAWQINNQTTALNAVRSGLVGLALACLLYLLWKMDCRVSENVTPNRGADRIIFLLGVLLWLVWFGACQMIFMASDEIKVADYSEN